MAENNWLLNDIAPVSLAQEFAAPAAEQGWEIHDSAPLPLAMQFAAAAVPWVLVYWGPPPILLEAGAPPAEPDLIVELLAEPIEEEAEGDFVFAFLFDEQITPVLLEEDFPEQPEPEAVLAEQFFDEEVQAPPLIPVRVEDEAAEPEDEEVLLPWQLTEDDVPAAFVQDEETFAEGFDGDDVAVAQFFDDAAPPQDPHIVMLDAETEPDLDTDQETFFAVITDDDGVVVVVEWIVRARRRGRR